MRSVFTCILSILLWPAFGAAQAVNNEMCLKLANEIATGETVQFSNQQFDALKKYAYCGNEIEGNSTGLDVGFKAFSLGYSNAEAKQKNVCEQEFQSLKISETDYRKAKQVFDRALDTIDRCLALANHQWDVRYIRYSEDAFAVGISHHGGNGDILKSANIYPRDSLSCKGIPEGEHKVTTTAPVNIECERTPTKQMVGGVEVITAPDATLSLFLGATPLPITLPGYGGSPFDEINKKIEELRATQAELKTAYDSKMTEFATAKGAALEKTSSNNWQECPPGHYVEAIRGKDVDNGGFCGSCISQIVFRCRKLGM
ncbi:hypothetical protein I6F26_10305 [Ensifer sp. IC3342]|nr:hypothetical protein [Ensifer sp. BRP08]MCA1446971.1 hypothetical protein [Ensifer sp. IC3342]